MNDNIARYFQWEIANDYLNDDWGKTVIDQIDIYWRIAGQTDDE